MIFSSALTNKSDERTNNFRLAPSVLTKERSLFMIKVLYFVQVKVVLGQFQKDMILKVPFLLAPDSKHSPV